LESAEAVVCWGIEFFAPKKWMNMGKDAATLMALKAIKGRERIIFFSLFCQGLLFPR